MRDKPLFGFKLGLNFLIGSAELLVLGLNSVVELLNATEVVNIAFEVDILLLS